MTRKGQVPSEEEAKKIADENEGDSAELKFRPEAVFLNSGD